MEKGKQTKSVITIPSYGQISFGRVPSSGATVSSEKIVREFKRAAKFKLVPPPEVFTTASE